MQSGSLQIPDSIESYDALFYTEHCVFMKLSCPMRLISFPTGTFLFVWCDLISIVTTITKTLHVTPLLG